MAKRIVVDEYYKAQQNNSTEGKTFLSVRTGTVKDFLQHSYQKYTRFSNSLYSYILACALPIIVVLIKTLSPSLGVKAPFLFSLFSVVFATYYGGLIPGIVATLFSAALTSYFFLEPINSVLVTDGTKNVQLLSFIIQGFLISWLIAKQQLAQKELILLGLNLEKTVQTRTDSLRQTSAILQKSSHKLQKTNQELERSNKELEDFAYIASHDLQEPLRKIQSFTNLLVEEHRAELSTDARMYLDRIISSAGRMRRLIQDLLEYSRVTTKAQPFTVVDLQQVIENVLSDLTELTQEKKATVTVVSPLPKIEADATQMFQLFQNLIVNGVKFSKPGIKPELIIDTQTVKIKHQQWIVISFKDNGIGIDKKYLDRIFTIFERLHSKKEYEGTGIGLAVVRKIVDRHRGSIKVESEVGSGTQFTIALPKVQKQKGTI